MDKNKSRRKKLQDRLLSQQYFFSALFWVIAGIGVLALIVGIITNIYGNLVTISNIAFRISEACIISVLISVISKSSYFVDFFCEILEDIVYSAGHIENRSDKEDIWERITTCLFKDKIPGLHHEISTTIKNNYIPTSEITYYNNYRQIIKLTWVDRERRILKSEDAFSFDLHTNNEQEFSFERTTWKPKYLNKEYDGVRKVSMYKVNGKDCSSLLTSHSNEPDKEIVTYTIVLKGSLVYHIEQKTERTFCLDDDPYSGFKAKWLVNNMDVRIKHPIDLDVTYISRGTTTDFNIVKKEEDSLDIEYKGLILRKQGYILLFQIKTTT